MVDDDEFEREVSRVQRDWAAGEFEHRRPTRDEAVAIARLHRAQRDNWHQYLRDTGQWPVGKGDE